jgi:hypothetical protein
MFEMMNCEVEEGLKSEDSIFEAEHRWRSSEDNM